MVLRLMKLNTVMPYNQTAVQVDFTILQNDAGEMIRQYFDDGVIDIRFIAKNTGSSIVYTKSELRPLMRLHSIKDKGGVLAIDATYRVDAVLPTLNALGYSDGYAYKVTKYAGE